MKNFFLRIKNLIRAWLTINSSFKRLNDRLDEIQINQGLILSRLNQYDFLKTSESYEFKVFSQMG